MTYDDQAQEAEVNGPETSQDMYEHIEWERRVYNCKFTTPVTPELMYRRVFIRRPL